MTQDDFGYDEQDDEWYCFTCMAAVSGPNARHDCKPEDIDRHPEYGVETMNYPLPEEGDHGN